MEIIFANSDSKTVWQRSHFANASDTEERSSGVEVNRGPLLLLLCMSPFPRTNVSSRKQVHIIINLPGEWTRKIILALEPKI